MAENLLQPIQEAKAERLAGIQSMFEDMGKFRMQWQEYHREREKSVWGGERVKSTPATPQKAKASQTLVPKTKPKAVKSAPSTTTAAQSTTPTAVVVAEPTKPAVPPNQPKPTTVVPHPPNPGWMGLWLHLSAVEGTIDWYWGGFAVKSHSNRLCFAITSEPRLDCSERSSLLCQQIKWK